MLQKLKYLKLKVKKTHLEETMKMFKWMMMTALVLAGAIYADKPVLKIAYSDWPGWTAWEIADKKGFFQKHGVNVKLEWLEMWLDFFYKKSMVWKYCRIFTP